jgi:hypothetical protein
MNEQEIVEALEAPIEAAATTIVETVEVIKHDPLIIAGAALIGLSTGALIGYRLAKRYLEPKYAALAEEEIQQARILYAHRTKDGDSPSVVVNKLIPDEYPDAQQAMAKYQGKDVHLTVVEDGVIVSARLPEDLELKEPLKAPEARNVFEEAEPVIKYEGWDYESELARRTDANPFIVTQDEFFENDDNLEVIQCTYYEGDDVLEDGSGGIIGDIAGTVGRDNLKKFGHGSGEEHVVYIFNKKAGLAFEVSRHEGRYAVEVLGFDDEETQERMPRRGRKFMDD